MKLFSALKRLVLPVKLYAAGILNRIRIRGKTKYFCIGRNKTGTTSLKKAFEDLGYVVGNQRAAELLYDKYYFEDNFDPIIKYCETAQVFQDVPFSCFNTLAHLDKAYPGSKFILTIRDSTDQWYNSITKFHAKKFGKGGRIPTAEDLKKATYVRPGFMQNTMMLHETPESDPYNKEIMFAHYERHNADVLEYFKNRPDDLLVINLSDKDAYQKFVDFIGIDTAFDSFPWENKT
jgi:hypothetical protein